MTKSAVLLRRNNGYFGQKVAKTLFGNSPDKLIREPAAPLAAGSGAHRAGGANHKQNESSDISARASMTKG